MNHFNQYQFRFFIVVFCWVYPTFSYSQSFNNLRSVEIIYPSDSVVTDSLFISKKSITIVSQKDTLPPHCWSFVDNKISLRGCNEIKKSNKWTIKYRVLQSKWTLENPLRSQRLQMEENAQYIGLTNEKIDKTTRTAILDNSRLDYNGSFVRNISVGNNQSLVLNSNFNLQMSGDLGDGLLINAAISDENLPIQPEGNTQLLHEFDKVFIELSKGQSKLIAGDYTLLNEDNYFLRYNKKLKGISGENAWKLNLNDTLVSSANYAVARGKYARISLNTTEANQGPYKLNAPDGSRVLRISSGTEKVFLDGIRLTRGIDNDYVISYDRAEITFTALTRITKDSRIVVEFDYTDQNYVRSQYSSEVKLKGKKLKAGIIFYSEQDAKTPTNFSALDSLQLLDLASIGDNFQNNFTTSIRPFSSQNNTNETLYELRIDSITNREILVHSTDTTQQLYTAIFTELGPNLGDYIIDDNSPINGRVYIYVGENEGNFLPVIQLIPPERRQVVSSSVEYAFSNSTTLKSDLSISNTDLNRISSLDNDDNVGIAARLAILHSQNLSSKNTNSWKLDLSTNFEFRDKNYTPINPYRNPEFSRNWSLTQNYHSNEILTHSKVGLRQSPNKYIQYGFDNYLKPNLYKGFQHAFEARYEWKNLKIFTKNSLLNSKNTHASSRFLKPYLELKKHLPSLWNLTIAASYMAEHNRTNSLVTDSISTVSFAFDIKDVSLSKKTKNFTTTLSLSERIDQLPKDNNLSDETKATSISLQGNWQQKSSQLSYNFSIRKLQVLDNSISIQRDQTSYLGKIDYRVDLLNGSIKSTSNYEINNGQEAKIEYEYVQVRSGEGQYIWIDDGDNQEEINEFILGPVQDTANYVRISIFNNEFINTNNNQFSQSLRFSGNKLIKFEDRKKNFFYKLISKLSNNTSYRIRQKIENRDDSNPYSPFSFDFDNPDLVSYNAGFNSIFFFNQGDSKYDIQWSTSSSTNKRTQITGTEIQKFSDYNTRVRYNFNRHNDLIISFVVGTNENQSENFLNNNYDIHFLGFSPEISFRPNNKIRLSLNYTYQDRKNQTGDQLSQSNDIGIRYDLRPDPNASLHLSLNYANVNYSGTTNPIIELAMLDGLRDGNNFLWIGQFSKKLSNQIDLLLSYKGRKTGNSSFVHNATMQIKANF